MALVVIKKNEVRVALIDYHREVIDLLKKFSNSYRLHEFEGELDAIANEIKKNMRKSPNKKVVRKALKGVKRKMVDVAKNSKFNKKLSSELFFQNYFGGIPLDSKTLSEAPYDLVIEIEPNNTVAWVFAPYQFENINNSEIMNNVNCDFNKQCSQVQTKYSLELPFPKLLTYEVEETESKLTQSINPENDTEAADSEPETEPESEPLESDEPIIPVYIGRVEFGNKSKMLLQEKRFFDKIEGLIREEAAATVSPSEILVIESLTHDDIIFASVTKMEINKKNTATNFNSYTYLGVKIFMRPLLQKIGNYLGKVVATDLSGYKIRKPTIKEISLVTNMPKDGLPLGNLDFGDNGPTCFYPFDPNSKTLQTSLYQSMFVAGVQNSGKTNGLKYIVQAITSCDKFDFEKRPAVIIIDGENSFTQFTPIEKMPQKTQEFFSQHNIGKVNPKVFTLAENETFADSTLSFESLTYNDMIYLLPELEAKTEGRLLSILKLAFEILNRNGYPKTVQNIRNTALSEARSSGLIHPSQVPAIGRALDSVELDIFNQIEKTELTPDLLFQPGQISVLNVHRLDKNRRRIAALYVLQLLNRFKMENSNMYPGVILVIDEAEQLFPNKPSKHEKDFVDRIAERCEDITNRGRKRRYGIFLVSHLPSEVSPRVVALANTQMAFRCSVADPWIARTFGREYVPEINDLSVGTCRIKVNLSTMDQKPINTRIYMPNVEEVKNH